jgi:lipid II:glycine glycyltransferase (peptidoglycan interpeptide bridge formation enzyme)
MYPRYFLQTQNWAEFWLQAQSNYPGHEIIKDSLVYKSQVLDYFIYQYPYHLKSSFWYLPKVYISPELIDSENDWVELLSLLLKQVSTKAKEADIDFLKFEVDPQAGYTQSLLDEDISASILQLEIGYKIKKSSKKIQFLQTSTINCSDLQVLQKDSQETLQSQNFEASSLQTWYQKSLQFWKARNNKIQRYTKKSLTQDWSVSTVKDQVNFEKFYKVYGYTKTRQNFAIHPRDYLETLYENEFSRVIILSDETGEPHCVWLGYQSENTLTYLSGGNTKESFKKQGQYLTHLIALMMCSQENLEFYDLGGYDPKLGFGKFKEGYRGHIRTFPGPFDVILNPKKYWLVNTLMKVKNIISR